MDTECEVTPVASRRFVRTLMVEQESYGVTIEIAEGATYCEPGCEWCETHRCAELHGTLDPSSVALSLSVPDLNGPQQSHFFARLPLEVFDLLADLLPSLRDKARSDGLIPARVADEP